MNQTGLENRRSGNATVGSNPTLSADLCGFPDKDDAAQDAPFTSRSTAADGAHVGTPESRFSHFREWMHCPTGCGEMRFHKDRFATFLERTGVTTGRPPKPLRRVPALRHARFGEEAELLALVRGEHFESVYHKVFREWAEGHEWFAPHPDILAEIDRLNNRPATGRQSSAGLTTTKGYIRHGIR